MTSNSMDGDQLRCQLQGHEDDIGEVVGGPDDDMKASVPNAAQTEHDMDSTQFPRMSDHDVATIWSCVVPYIHDHNAASLVCKQWDEVDRRTRKRVTVKLCYAATPKQLSQRFTQLESLEIRGLTGAAAMFSPDGSCATPWVEEVAKSFTKMKALHFRRMHVIDSDLELLAASEAGAKLEVLDMYSCLGFTTHGLLSFVRSCRNLKSLSLELCDIEEHDGEWLRELVTENAHIQNLNYCMTNLNKVESEYIELLARRSPSLTCLKITETDMPKLVQLFTMANSLQEFAGTVVEPKAEDANSVVFPSNLDAVSLCGLDRDSIRILYPIAVDLKELDICSSFLDTEGHYQLLKKCRNLEVLATGEVIGDKGLKVVSEHCKNMKRLGIYPGDDFFDIQGVVSQSGLFALSQGCQQLEHLILDIRNITNSALECIGSHSKNLLQFRLSCREQSVNDGPLDNGVSSLLQGCTKLIRFDLNLRGCKGCLTDVGLGRIGEYSAKVRRMSLSGVGQSDAGLIAFANGCPSLEILEMMGDCSSESAVAEAVVKLRALTYLFVKGYRLSSENNRALLVMNRPHWNIEVIATAADVDDDGVFFAQDPPCIFAYYSLAGPRSDRPGDVIRFDASAFLDSSGDGDGDEGDASSYEEDSVYSHRQACLDMTQSTH